MIRSGLLSETGSQSEPDGGFDRPRHRGSVTQLARERDFTEERRRTSPKGSSEVRPYPEATGTAPCVDYVSLGVTGRLPITYRLLEVTVSGLY